MNNNYINSTNSTNSNNLNGTKESFKLFRKKIINKFDDSNDYCSNPMYRTIVFLILVGIIMYFIWFVSKKQYLDDIEIRDFVSTPFDNK